MPLEFDRQPSSIDLFAGAGGLALGIHKAGFSSVGLVEFNRHACATLRLNARGLPHAPEWPVFEADSRNVDYPSLATEVDLLAAGAPCQPFSLGGKHRGDEDGRNMFPDVFRAIRALRPKAILLENVRGLTRQSFRPYFDYILAQLHQPHLQPSGDEQWFEHRARLISTEANRLPDPAETYSVSWRVVNSADYGVPQKRERVIMVALRNDLDLEWTFPHPTHSEDRLLYEQFVTGSYWEEHSLHPRPMNPKLSKRVGRLRAVQPDSLAWRTLRTVVRGLPEPVDGVPSSEWSFHIGIPGARLYKGHTGNDLDKPAKTIKAGDHGNPGGEHILLKDDGSIRYMTVRECARVQAFPDTYQFSGSRTEAMRQIGNAVPITLAEVIARSIKSAIDRASRKESEPATEFALVAN